MERVLVDSRRPRSVNPISIRPKSRIDEKGSATVKQIEGTDPYFCEAMRTAIEKWQFLVTIIQNRSRRTETELPILFGRSLSCFEFLILNSRDIRLHSDGSFRSIYRSSRRLIYRGYATRQTNRSLRDFVRHR